jgi:hypothetical protein
MVARERLVPVSVPVSVPDWVGKNRNPIGIAIIDADGVTTDVR